MSLLPRKENGKIDIRAMWEYKLLKFIVMTVFYFLLLIYALLGAQSTWKWMQMRYYGGDFSEQSLIQAVETLSDDKRQIKLVELIHVYPYTTDELVGILENEMKDFHAHFFFSMANRYAGLGDMDAARFWTMLGRYRLRYDALRCDHMTADTVSDKYVEYYILPAVKDDMATMGEDARRAVLADVLAWDDAHPPENDPRYFCEFIEDTEQLSNIGVIPRDQWPLVRRLMRATAQRYIDSGNDASGGAE